MIFQSFAKAPDHPPCAGPCADHQPLSGTGRVRPAWRHT